MKIKSYQSGGIVYLPTTNRREEAASQAASSSSSSTKVPGFADKILDMVKENGIDVDVNKFLNQVNMTLDLANDPTGENLSMREVLKLAHQAAVVRNNYVDYGKARESLDSQDAWGDVALDSHGDIYVFNNETQKIEAIGLNQYIKNKDTYIALTNEDLLDQRRTNSSLAFKNSVLDDISRAVGTHTIVKYVNELISKFKDTEITGYANKQTSDIQSGMQAIVNGQLTGGNSVADAIIAGSDGIYKISQKSTHADTHLGEALNYIINALPNDYKKSLAAKAAVEGFDLQAMLLEMITTNTGRTINANWESVSSKSARGEEGEGGKALTQGTLAEFYAEGNGHNPQQLMEITPNDSKTSLLAFGQNVGPVLKDNGGKPGNPMPTASIAQLYEDAYAIRSITSNTVCFGDQLIKTDDLGGLVYDGSDMHRIVLPAKKINGGRDIVPDFELQQKLNDIVENAQNQGADETVVNRYLQEVCPGAKYNAQTGEIRLPADRKHAFLTFGARGADNYIEFDSNSKYLVKDDSDPESYMEAAKYGYANHKKTDRERVEGGASLGGWFKPGRTKNHLYKGNVFIPITSDIAGSAIYNPEYRPKSAYTNVTARSMEHDRQMQIRDRLSDFKARNW